MTWLAAALAWAGAGLAWLGVWKVRRAIHAAPETVRRRHSEQVARDSGACGDGVGE